MLREADHLAGLTESFHAVTVPRQFPNPLLAELLAPAADKARQASVLRA
jgi:LysR family transcriptional activator of nhaA